MFHESRYATLYSIVPGRRNWQIETAAWIWPSFFHCALETRWLGVRKTCGIGLFYRNYRPLLQETGWLVSDFISVCLETRWLGQKKWFLCPGAGMPPEGLAEQVRPRKFRRGDGAWDPRPRTAARPAWSSRACFTRRGRVTAASRG